MAGARSDRGKAGGVGAASTRALSRPVPIRTALLEQAVARSATAPLGCIVFSEPGCGATSIARALAGRLAVGEVRWIRAHRALATTPGGVIAAMLPGAPHGGVLDEARILGTRLAPLARGGVLGIDGAEHVDERSAALFVTATEDLGVRLVLASQAGRPLPAAFAAAVTSGDLATVTVDRLDPAQGRALVGEFADGQVEWDSTDRLAGFSGGSPLLLRAMVDQARSAGALDESGGLLVLSPGWVPDPVAWRAELDSRRPEAEDADEKAVLELTAILGTVHADDLAALGLETAVSALVDRGLVVPVPAEGAGWPREGLALTMEPVAAVAVIAHDDDVARNRLLTRYRQVVARDTLADLTRVRLTYAALRVGIRLDVGDLLGAFEAGDRGAPPDLLLFLCRTICDRVLTRGAADDDDGVRLALAVASYLSWHGDTERSRSALAPHLAAGRLSAHHVAVACELEGERDLRRVEYLLDRAFDLAGDDPAAVAETEGWELIGMLRSGVAVAPGTLLAASRVATSSRWLRSELAAGAVLGLVVLGRAHEAERVVEEWVDPVRRSATSHREQAVMWHAAHDVVLALGHPMRWVHDRFSPTPDSVLTVPTPIAHVVAGASMSVAGQVLDAVGAYRQALALLSDSDPHGVTGIVLTDLRRARLQLSRTSQENWVDLLRHESRGTASGPRQLEIRTNNAIIRVLESGAEELDEEAARMLEELRARGAWQLELSALQMMWRFGLETDLDRLVEVAGHCDGPVAAAIADQVRGLTDDEAAVRAVDAFERCGRPLLAAEAAMLRSRTLEAADDAAADSAADRARELVDRLGPVFTPMLGLRSTKDPALSERESEIATLVADGLSNREIAVRLSLSPRTVDAHMSRIMGRLGLRSRRQLRNPTGEGAPQVSTGQVPVMIVAGGPREAGGPGPDG